MPPIYPDGTRPSQATPPAPPPPPPKHTARPGETLDTIAVQHHVSVQELATANRLSPNAKIEAGQELVLPANARLSQEERHQGAPQTPQEKTDAAYDAYLQAQRAVTVDSRTQAGHADLADARSALAQAKSNFDQAVQAEIAGKVAQANAGTPPEYRASESQLIDQFGAQIQARYQGDAKGQSEVQAAVADYQLTAKAEALIPGYYGDFSPAEKLEGIDLKGQPQAVIDKVLADPRVQQWIKDAAAQVGKPYEGVTDPASAEQQAPEAAKRLADTVDGLPPALATAVVKASMPTIEKIAQCEMIYGGQGAFTSLQKAVGSMGGSDQAKVLTDQIAKAYTAQVKKWEGFSDQATKAAIGDGGSPALAIAVAGKLEADGKDDQATGLVNLAGQGVSALQAKLKGDLKEYAETTQELNWLIKNAGPNLTKAQLQQAIDRYVKSKGPDFQNKLDEQEKNILEDVRSLKSDVAQLKGMPDDLKKLSPGIDASLNSVMEDDQTQSAVTFAASRDPSIFAGDEGSEFAATLVELGHKSKDLTNAAAKAYVASNVLPAISSLNQNDPASVARANKVLDDFQSKAAKLLGIPQKEVDDNVAKLRQIVTTLQTTKSIDEAVTNIHALDTLKSELQDLKETTFSSGAAGLAFRSIAFGLSGAALLNSANKTIDDPNAQNVIGTLAFSAGLAQDTAGFGASIKLLDSEGGVGGWGLAQGTAGKLTEKFIGVLNVAYFAAGAVQEGTQGDAAGTVFNAVGAGGAALATFGEAVGLGSWAGPVGVGVTLLATAGLALVEWRKTQDEHSEAAEQFLKGAGLDEKVAKTLSHDATEEASNLRNSLDISPAQLSELAESHPELFGAPGYAQAVIDVVNACGLKGDDAVGFIDTLSKDNPNFVSNFFNQKVASGSNGQSPLSHRADLVDLVSNGYPQAKAYLQSHAPAVLGPDGRSRRKADRDYEATRSTGMSSPANIANLLKNQSDPAYQAEIIKVMKDNAMLDGWIKAMGSNYAYNGWPEAAKAAVQSAQSQGVLSADQAQKYLAELPA